MSHPIYIAVVGAGEASDYDAIAEQVGREVALAGAYLVSGGLGGTMEAACRGAKAAGGTTIGLLPTARRSHANDYVDVAIPTGMGEMRNALVVRAADVVIAIDGEFGTLSEVAFALKTQKPVVGLDTWELSRGGERSDAVHQAASPAEAVELALGLVRPPAPDDA